MRTFIRDMVERALQAALDYLQESKERDDHRAPSTERNEGRAAWTETVEARGDRHGRSDESRSAEKKGRSHRRKRRS